VKYSHFVRVTFSHLHDFHIVLFREMILTWLCTRRKREIVVVKERRKEAGRQQNDRKGIAVREEARKRRRGEGEGRGTKDSEFRHTARNFRPTMKLSNSIFPILIAEHCADIVE